MPQQIQLRRGTAAAWTAANPTLAQGEMGVETDTGRFKVGTGAAAWNALSYALNTLPVGSITGLGANVGTFLATPSSANLASAVTDETGTGALVFASAPLLAGPILTGPEERCNVVAQAATGSINIDAITAGVWLYTSEASGDFTLNFRGNSGTTLNSLLATGDAITLVFINTNGVTPRRPTAFTIDTGVSGSAVTVTPLWQGGTAPTAGNASSRDVYTFTIIKTATGTPPTYLVLAAQTRFA